MGRGGHRALQRGGPKKKPKKKIFLVCEGANTEPLYFEALHRSGVKRNLFQLVPLGGEGVPSTLLAKALNIKKGRDRSNSFAENDEIWIVFDRDEHPCYFDTINRCRDAKLNAAYSNPCFEYWLILHFEDFNSPVGRGAVQKRLERLAASYSIKGTKQCSFDDLKDGVASAVARAQVGRKKRLEEGDEFGPPSTNVDLLVSEITA